MRVLSVRQPWAAAIAFGLKDIENRSWPTNVRGPVLIHATRWASEDEFADDLDFIGRIQQQRPRPLPKFAWIGGEAFRSIGQIIGRVDVVDCVDESSSPWFFGPYGFVLRNPARVEPIVIRGHLKFWEYSGEVKVL